VIRLVVLLLLTAIVVPGHRAHAQSLEPRSYANTPVGINFLLLGYGYLEGDVAFDASSRSRMPRSTPTPVSSHMRGP
jgi:hypothetical protein